MSSRRQFAFVAAVALILVGIVAVGRIFLKDELQPVGVGVRAPDFTAMTLDSIPRRKTLADYRGDVLFLNLWATWCGPCRVEMPSIEALYRAYSVRGLKVVGISVDDPGLDQAIRSFAKEYGLTFEILHDPKGQEGDVSRNYQTTGYPETIVIGRDGIIRKKFLGAHDWNSAESRALIDRLLAEKAE